jgi:hypothetical protein
MPAAVGDRHYLVCSPGILFSHFYLKIDMKKERKNRELSNEDIEKELERKGLKDDKTHNYIGSQDTGDQVVRSKGTDTQKRDGFVPIRRGQPRG